MRRVIQQMCKIGLGAMFALLVLSVPACVADDLLTTHAPEYHVSPDGDDARDGSPLAPWRTVQRAADTLKPGETVYVHDGIYDERVTINVSGSEIGGYVTFAAYPGARPILDGTGLPIPEEDAAMVLISDQNYVIVDGFEIRNYTASRANEFPTGILILGAPEQVVIRNNVVHHVGNNVAAAPGEDGPFANGIAVYGTRAPHAARQIRIVDNELHDLETGGSEALVVNGNVDGFEITGNYIHRVNNIAIDCIGFEGTAPAEVFDQARNGLVSGNRIEDISGQANRYYDPDPYGALGIYVDGGRDIVIERNTILRTDFGIEIASEHRGKKARGIVVQSNVIAESRTVGLSVGGWVEDWGGAEDVAIVNNTFFSNDTLQDGHGEIALLHHIEGIEFHNNVVFANEQGAFLLQEAPSVDAVYANHNLYCSPSGSADGVWIWNDHEFDTFSAYRTASGNDADSLAVDPLFVDPGSGLFGLRSGSPCIDAGDNSRVPESMRFDHVGQRRVLDGDGDGVPIVDLGAFESR